MTDNGKVIALTGQDAVVRVFRTTACGNCGMCGLDSGKKYIDVSMENTLNATVGDTVELIFSAAHATRVSAVVYLIPLFFSLLLMVAGYLLRFDDWLLVAVFAAGLALGFVVVRLLDKKFAKKKGVLPKMNKIIIPEVLQNE